jgi:hypothetical protein
VSLTHGEQPLVGQGIQHHPCVLVPASGELGQGHAAADHRLALARPGQPQQDPAGGLLLFGVKAGPGAFGQAGDRPAHPPGLLVGGQRQCPALAVLPALQQRARQQRQPTGLVGDLADHGVGQA